MLRRNFDFLRYWGFGRFEGYRNVRLREMMRNVLKCWRWENLVYYFLDFIEDDLVLGGKEYYYKVKGKRKIREDVD